MDKEKPKIEIIHADCLNHMKTMADNSIDFICCDPPYGISFMGREFDKFKNQPAFNPEYWKEALRICKPGSMLAAFGGDRTHHHLMNAIEEAGWEIRTCCYWLFGSGFPKSLDISKAIDKSKGLEREKEVRFRCDGKLAGGTIADGFINGVKDPSLSSSKIPLCETSNIFSGYGTALKPAAEIIVLAMKPLDGTFAQNAEKWGVAGINIEKSRIGISRNVPASLSKNKNGIGIIRNQTGQIEELNFNKGRWPSNLILDEEAAAQLDQMTGISKSRPDKRNEICNLKDKIYASGFNRRCPNNLNDSGGVSRFFKVVDQEDEKDISKTKSRFFYCAKSSSAERQGSKHPTIKPQKLIEYLIKLLAPPGNPVCLDPFLGSGTTGIVCKKLGISFIGIEKEEEYYNDAVRRITAAKEPEPELFDT